MSFNGNSGRRPRALLATRVRLQDRQHRRGRCDPRRTTAGYESHDHASAIVPVESRSMPSNWPELSLALALALVAAYAVTAFLTRRIERWLRALIPDARERRLVDNPLPVVRVVVFLVTAAASPSPRCAGGLPAVSAATRKRSMAARRRPADRRHRGRRLPRDPHRVGRGARFEREMSAAPDSTSSSAPSARRRSAGWCRRRCRSSSSASPA